jgi:DedD protein
MKFVIDERVKHRIAGLVVIISLATIFVPAVLKKSNRHFEENISLSVKLPAKPQPPKIAIRNEKAVFQSVKVAKVELPKVVESPKLAQIAKAESISIKSVIPAAPKVAVAKIEEAKAVPVKVATIAKPKNSPIHSATAAKKEAYAVQLASFAQQDNAKSLVNRLRNKGYVASYNKSSSKQGDIYKVIVGQVYAKDEALTLQKKLAESMQLKGFIIKTGVS